MDTSRIVSAERVAIEAPRMASKLTILLVMLKSVYVTLKISIICIFKVFIDRFSREEGNALLRWWSDKLLSFTQLKYTIRNPHNFKFEPDQPYIIMCNHSSHYDIPLIFMALPGSIRMLAKKELFQFPIWGRGLKAGEFVSIDRNNRKQAMRDLQLAKEKMKSGVILWVAPEGTRSKTGRLGPFKKGGFLLALQTGATILPVGIRGASNILPAKTLNLQLGCSVEIHIGQPIEASQYSPTNEKELMSDVGQRILELAQIERA
ncbi:lysophospholipid acyltransferase family protein [Deltaproteobacteria bacterium TL4]